MFQFFARLAVRRPVLTTMLVAVLVALGAYSYFNLGVDLTPEVDFPVVTVTTVYPGAGPEEVELQVTKPVEDAISTLADLEVLTSYSRENASIVIVEFDYGVDADLAAIDVKDKVDAIRSDLPREVESPTIQKFDINAQSIMDLALAGPQSLEALYDFADQVVSERLSRVTGVASVTITGGLEREVQIRVHPDRLRAYGLTITDLAQLVGAENLNVPSGRVTEASAELAVRVVGEYSSIDEIARLPLFLPNGGRIRLDDVATVEMGFADVREIARYEGQPAVTLAIQKRSDANTVTTAAGVLEAVDELEAQLPAGASLLVASDRSEFIRDAIQDILKNILIGIALTTVVLFLFLHSWRGTVVAAVAMPATIVATFLALDQLGFTINVMTLMALGITVGILVTNTIVVLESIYRHLDKGADPHTAAEEGTSEVAIAVAASALTNVVVFTPIAFMEGIIGQFFFAFGLTVIFATLTSVFISFTLAPLLSARLLRAGETGLQEHGRLGFLWRPFDAGYASLEKDYHRALSWTLRRPRNGWMVIFGTSMMVMAAAGVMASFVGGEFFPPQDEGLIQVALELPPGLPIRDTERMVFRAEELLSEIPEINKVLATIGQGSGGLFSAGGGINQAFIQATVDSDLPTEGFLPAIRERLSELPGTDVTATLGQTMGSGEAPLQVLIKGPDQDRLELLAQSATDVVASVPGLVDVRNTIEDSRPEIVFRPEREIMSEYGLTVAQIGATLRGYIEGVIPGVFREDGEERDIRIRLNESSRDQIAELGDLQVRTLTGMIPVSMLGQIEEEDGETTVLRDEKQRTVRIDAEIGSGSLASLAQEIETELGLLDFPPGYEYEITGEFEMFEETLTEMLKALIMAIVLTYIVLAMILESFVHPVTIMLTLPLGAVGAIFALFLTASNLNMFSMMAMIMLVGIVVNNAILILDYTQILRRKGRKLKEALLEAAPARLRPILMTNVAIGVALLPQATGSGAGSFYRIPMAVVTIGGVLFAAFFTLFLIPVIYQKLDRFAFAAHAREREERERHEH